MCLIGDYDFKSFVFSLFIYEYIMSKVFLILCFSVLGYSFSFGTVFMFVCTSVYLITTYLLTYFLTVIHLLCYYVHVRLSHNFLLNTVYLG